MEYLLLLGIRRPILVLTLESYGLLKYTILNGLVGGLAKTKMF